MGTYAPATETKILKMFKKSNEKFHLRLDILCAHTKFWDKPKNAGLPWNNFVSIKNIKMFTLNILSEFLDISKMYLKTGRTKHHYPFLLMAVMDGS
jgi:hypothetical protein